MKKLFLFLLLPLCLIFAQRAASPGLTGLTNTNLAPLPPMGWSSWITFGTALNETVVKASALAMSTNGMLAVGYQYINLDDGWMNFKRGPKNAPNTPAARDSTLSADPGKFPSGIPSLSTYIHGLVEKFGIYLSGGLSTCGGGGCDSSNCYWTLGSFGYEFGDAATIAAWNVDYLKFDTTCWMPFSSPVLASGMMYQIHVKMAKALRATGRNIMFTGGPGGSDDCAHWFASAGVSSSRIGDDMNPQTWAQMIQLGFNDNTLISQFGGPNHWLDLDFLIIGTGLTDTEGKVQISLWASQAAPLIVGTDIRSGVTANTLAIIENTSVIAVDQDPLGYVGTQVSNVACGDETCRVWAKKLTATNAWALSFYNRSSTSQTVSITWAALAAANPAFANMTYATNRDDWAAFPSCPAHDCGQVIAGTLSSGYSATVASHDVAMITVAP